MLANLRVGMLGGGQLGAMFVRHAIDLGLNVSVMDKDASSPTARYTSAFVCGDPANYDDVMRFGKCLDIITIEKEAVNIAALRSLAALGVKVFPAPNTIEIIQDKFSQKQFLLSHDIPVANGIAVDSRDEMYNYTDKIPFCIKKRRNGYDGKGVMVLKTAKDIAHAFDEPCVLEELVDIRQELSVIVARNELGEIKNYDPVAMVFDKELFLLDYQLSPAQLDRDILSEAANIAGKIAEALQLVGILAVEMFLTKDMRLVVNELAPRPHNSGHHTIETSLTSQYEQLVRAILGLPLGDTTLTGHSLMMNIIAGNNRQLHEEKAFKQLLGIKGVHLHWYGKKEHKPGRKIGHITIRGREGDNMYSVAKKVREILNQE